MVERTLSKQWVMRVKLGMYKVTWDNWLPLVDDEKNHYDTFEIFKSRIKKLKVYILFIFEFYRNAYTFILKLSKYFQIRINIHNS